MNRFWISDPSTLLRACPEFSEGTGFGFWITEFKSARALVIMLCALLSLVSFAHAQQPAKVARIGFLRRVGGPEG
jgi:hypothetical protein